MLVYTLIAFTVPSLIMNTIFIFYLSYWSIIGFVLFLITTYLMLLTALSDPGIIPRIVKDLSLKTILTIFL